MKVIKLIALPNADVWNGPFPGDGAFACSNGIALRTAGISTVINFFGWQSLLSDVEGTSVGGSAGSGVATIDVHRLVDQIANIATAPRHV